MRPSPSGHSPTARAGVVPHQPQEPRPHPRVWRYSCDFMTFTYKKHEAVCRVPPPPPSTPKKCFHLQDLKRALESHLLIWEDGSSKLLNTPNEALACYVRVMLWLYARYSVTYGYSASVFGPERHTPPIASQNPPPPHPTSTPAYPPARPPAPFRSFTVTPKFFSSRVAQKLYDRCHLSDSIL